MNRKITFLLPLFVLGFLLSAQAQCPPNIDFETAGTGNWLYWRGSCYSPGGVMPTYTFTSCAPVPTLHTLTSTPGTDYYGGFPVVAPGGGLHSLKLGKDSINYSTMKCAYNVHVPSGPGLYSFIYRYAVVLENPTGHTIYTEPRFIVEGRDSITHNIVGCDSFNYVGDGTEPGFLASGVTSLTGGGTDVSYKTWTMGNMKFPGEAGKTVTVSFIAQGCTQSGHFGYGYLDMSCGFFADNVVTCASGTTTLTGPDGFAGYHWWDSLTFSTSYGTSQSVGITSPTTTTTYAVILTPYSGYGCTDTLYTKVFPTSLTLHRTHDTTVCSGTPVTISMGAVTPYSTTPTYLWGPSLGLSCVTCASPVATPTVSTNYFCTVTDSAGCQLTDTVHITVVGTPGPITGPLTVCQGQTITLSDSPPGGTWTSSAPGIASIAAVTGVVTGVTVGTTAIITYTLGASCRVTRGVTVTANPAPITGTGTMCIGTSTTLFDTTSGGTWSSTSGLISVTGAGTTGVITGISAGTATVTYRIGATGCYVTKVVTVNPSPAAISGTSTVCVGGTLIVVDLTPGGTWSASPSLYGTINPVTGVISGLSAGVLTVTYSLPTLCATTTTVNVLPIPGPISGPTLVCIGDSITLTDPTTGGTWVASNSNVAIPDPSVGLLIGEPVGGADTISYTAGTSSCPSLYIVTVNPSTSPINVAGGGPPQLCVGQTLLLNDADPGFWSASAPGITTIGSTTGIVNGITTGTDTITFTNSLGCKATIAVTVNPLPAVITGPTSLCVGTTITLSDATPSGTFTTSGTHASVSPTGTVTGLTVGTQMITYTSTLGCYVTYMVTVNTTPPNITGLLSVCQGLTTVLSDGISGGIWSITPTTIGSIVGTVTTATVTGVNPGTATVTYTLGVGCSTSSIVTVNPMPGPITPGVPVVCVGSTVTLADPTSPGGTWSPVTGTNANINAITGVVTGINNGIQIFTYTAATTCIRPVTVNVNPLPLPISGPSSVCVGSTITLTDGSGGGTWTSLNLPIATIIGSTGVLTGVAAGTATIRYQLPTGCATATIVTVNPIPTLCTMTPATGTYNYCAGGTGISMGLTCSTVGVNYTLKNGATVVATLPGTGSALAFGPQTAAGAYTIVASYATSGCSRTMTGTVTVSINPVPVITGPTALCVGATMTETSSITSSTWTSSIPGNASIGATTGIVTGITTGSSTVITCTAPTGCTSAVTVNVTPSPTPITGASTVCVGDSTLFTDGVPGGTWTSASPIIAAAGAYTGYIYGVSAGTTTITYSLGSGCQQTKSITVVAQPAPITTVSGGPMIICQGVSLPLHDATTPGTWSVAPFSSALATVSVIGVVTATITGGTSQTQAAIIYGSTATGCHSWAYVTINPLPSPIAGTFQVCQGSSTPLTDPTGSGTWSISSTAYATISATTGTLTGVTAGSPSIVSYTVAGCSATQLVTVNALPGTLTGTSHVCTGESLTLSSSSPGGTWTVAPLTTATINPTSGSITGIVPGTALVTYTLPTTCLRTMSVTVNQTPSPITGPAGVCVPNGASMSDPTPGGSWSSSIPSIATINPGTGLITTGPTLTGSVIISYTVGTCSATAPFNVFPHPAPILGTPNVCVGSTTALTDVTPGGAWTSGTPSLGSVSTTGVVTGIASGTVIITYGAAGCNSIAPVVVNPITPVIGDSIVCVGQTIGLTDATLGGNWTSTITSIATVAPTTGIVLGVSAGTTAVIKYTIAATGCTASRTLTVNPIPASISGPSSLCVGQTTVYTDITPGGGWTSSNPAIGSIDVGGNLTGIAAGVVTITYQLSATSCYVTYPVTINGLPSAISGPSNICIGSSATYTDASGIGTWISSAPGVASIGLTSGIAVAGSTPGSTTLTFTLLSTGCATTMPVNVINLPTAIYSTGPAVICQFQSIALYDTSGTGTWAGSSSAIASVSSTGVVTGLLPGTDTITYSTGAGCVTTPFVVTVNQTPNSPTSSTGSFHVCEGQSLTLSSYPGGGTWSSISTANATITSVTGVVSGIAAGSSVISYALPTGCAISTIIFVDATPPAITGINTVCIGMTSPLADATSGGIWSSSAAAATVSTSGVVTGVSAGTTTISYMLAGTACPAMMAMTVNPVPGPITGANTVCVGQNITLHDAVPGTGWSSANTAIATVSTAGIVTGVAGGTTTITYTLGAGCYVDTTVNVIALPGTISGGDSVCQGQSLFFTSSTPSGTWTSTVPAVGSINATTGAMLGVAAGTTTISYTVNGCSVFQPVTVDVQPAIITGNPIVCLGSTSSLHDAVGGGVWTSSNTTVAPVSTSGVVFGSSLGTATITYMHSPGACSSTLSVNVVPLPLIFNVTGGGSYCNEGSGVNIGLDGTTVGINYMLYHGGTATGSFAGTGSPIGFGLQTLAGTYNVIGTSTSTGCSNNMAGSAFVTIIPNAIPSVNITTTPNDTVCTGTTVTFTPAPVSGGTAPAYHWTVNGTSVATTNTYTFIPANGDTVGLSMTSNAVCPLPAVVSHSMVMHVQPFANPSLSLTAHPGDTVCQGTVADITVNPVYGGDAPVFTWMKNGVIVSTASDYSFLPVNNDVIYCIMRSNYPCRLQNIDTSANIVMKIDTPLMPIVSIATSPNTMVQLGSKVTMTASVVNGGLAPTYQWVKNSIPVAGATTNVYVDSASIAQSADSISVLVTSSGYCPATAHQWVYIQVANVGVGQINNSIGDISVVPNPNKGDFIIKGSVGANNEDVSLELTDVLGQVVYTNKVTAPGGKLNEHVVLGSKLANGMYILSVRTAAESRVFHMVIEQ